ncbi:hypothetical protein Nepgr_011568 [Nepenthes gracilis]|uniref:Histone-lysine N-methyltransferase SUVR3 n=1 Tax=Nepenthes gracilis TaxID=150966 RepID=A0AAD3SEK8_NEPGR|nr:hypothetical protein Nepgr_011568 [Nepenthes gracilis]
MSTPENLLQKRDTHRENLFLSCAGLILPWLTPQELASISLTCKSLKHIAKSITVARSSDAARSFESLPIPFVNTVDSLPYAYFIYTPTQLLPYYRQCSRQFWGPVNPSFNHISRLHFISSSSNSLGEAFGCNCDSKCDGESNEEECPCLALRSSDVITECGPTCRCESECVNRLTQKGVSVKMKIVRDMKKGWGLHADQKIPNGQFVCEYAGELLTTKEARRRQLEYDELASSGRFSSSLLVIREHLPSGKACFRINIDATRIGNAARFINHSCDGGNLSTVLVRSCGAFLPRICFFASEDIQVGEELTFSYGNIRLRSDGLPCYCGSCCCFGTLPSENT